MAIIGVRELLHESKKVLARVTDDKEPVVITRHGKPVAALVPVDPANAERYVLQAAPELIETRERTTEQGPDLKTIPLEAAARAWGVEDVLTADPENGVDPEKEHAEPARASHEAAFAHQLLSIFGDEKLAEWAARRAGMASSRSPATC